MDQATRAAHKDVQVGSLCVAPNGIVFRVKTRHHVATIVGDNHTYHELKLKWSDYGLDPYQCDWAWNVHRYQEYRDYPWLQYLAVTIETLDGQHRFYSIPITALRWALEREHNPALYDFFHSEREQTSFFEPGLVRTVQRMVTQVKSAITAVEGLAQTDWEAGRYYFDKINSAHMKISASFQSVLNSSIITKDASSLRDWRPFGGVNISPEKAVDVLRVYKERFNLDDIPHTTYRICEAAIARFNSNRGSTKWNLAFLTHIPNRCRISSDPFGTGRFSRHYSNDLSARVFVNPDDRPRVRNGRVEECARSHGINMSAAPELRIYNYSHNALNYFGLQRLPIDGANDGLDMYLGVEFETRYNNDADLRYAYDTMPHVIAKSDGSIGGVGAEFVSAPATINFHRRWWYNFFTGDRFVSNFNPASSCGMHVHVDRRWISKLMYLKILRFMWDQANAEFFSKIAGRSVLNNGYCQMPRIAAGKKKWVAYNPGNRGILNVGKQPTIEFRLFQAPRTYERFCCNLEFAHSVVAFSQVAGLNQIDVPSYLEYVTKNQGEYPMLYGFLASNNLVPKNVPYCKMFEEIQTENAKLPRLYRSIIPTERYSFRDNPVPLVEHAAQPAEVEEPNPSERLMAHSEAAYVFNIMRRLANAPSNGDVADEIRNRTAETALQHFVAGSYLNSPEQPQPLPVRSSTPSAVQLQQILNSFSMSYNTDSNVMLTTNTSSQSS